MATAVTISTQSTKSITTHSAASAPVISKYSLSGLLSAFKKHASSYVIFFSSGYKENLRVYLLAHFRPQFEICYDTSGRRTCTWNLIIPFVYSVAISSLSW